MTENYRSPTVCSCRHSRSSASVTKRVDCIADLAVCRKVTMVIEPDCTKLAGKYVLKLKEEQTNEMHKLIFH